MPQFVPVFDPEKPRSEQSGNDPNLRKHRIWEAPHALDEAQKESVRTSKTQSKETHSLAVNPRKHGQMVRDHRGLWVKKEKEKIRQNDVPQRHEDEDTKKSNKRPLHKVSDSSYNHRNRADDIKQRNEDTIGQAKYSGDRNRAQNCEQYHSQSTLKDRKRISRESPSSNSSYSDYERSSRTIHEKHEHHASLKRSSHTTKKKREDEQAWKIAKASKNERPPVNLTEASFDTHLDNTKDAKSRGSKHDTSEKRVHTHEHRSMHPTKYIGSSHRKRDMPSESSRSDNSQDSKDAEKNGMIYNASLSEMNEEKIDEGTANEQNKDTCEYPQIDEFDYLTRKQREVQRQNKKLEETGPTTKTYPSVPHVKGGSSFCEEEIILSVTPSTESQTAHQGEKTALAKTIDDEKQMMKAMGLPASFF